MSWLQRFLLRRLARELVVQGPSHQGNITEYYAILAEAARVEFIEDNKPTLDGFLLECHEASIA